MTIAPLAESERNPQEPGTAGLRCRCIAVGERRHRRERLELAVHRPDRSTGEMLPLRQSILNRRPRTASAYSKNEENMDKEYHQQLKLLKAQQDKYYMKEAEVKQRVSPNKEETKRRQEDMKKCMEDQLRIKAEQRMRRAQEEHDLHCYNEYLNRFAPHCLEFDLERMHDKKEYLRGLMEDNMRVAEMKKELQKKEKQREIELDHIRAKTPCCWNKRHYI